jgi:exo-beta-1,3-glucanase (GH17 family)
MKSNGINNIRTYSQECDQLPNIINAIKSNGGGMSVLAAVWIDGSSNDDKEIATLKSNLAKVDTSVIEGILVGNEVLFKNIMSSSALVSKLNAVKAIAKGLKVGSVEIDGTYTKDLVAASDIVCANIHPFFAQVDINGALQNLQTRYSNFQKVAGSKKVYITETGWPSAGPTSGKSVPSTANLQKFVSAVSTTSLPYYFFEWEDSKWKSSGVESNFGLHSSSGKAKFAL